MQTDNFQTTQKKKKDLNYVIMLVNQFQLGVRLIVIVGWLRVLISSISTIMVTVSMTAQDCPLGMMKKKKNSILFKFFSPFESDAWIQRQ